jgi:acetate kinase
MAILAVNAGSSSLKFSVHPVVGSVVQPSVLLGIIQGLEPQGAPEMGWTFEGQSFSEPVVSKGIDVFEEALLALRNLLKGMSQ